MCWHLELFEVTLPAVVPGASPEPLLEIVTNTAVTSAVIKRCCLRLTHLTENGSLDKRFLPPGYSWLARCSGASRGMQGIAKAQLMIGESQGSALN